jgi:hypothetical protein
MKARSRRWEFAYARQEDATPTIWDPASIINDAAAPGTGVQLTGTVVSLDAVRSFAIVDVTPGAVFKHNVRTVTTYAGAVETVWAAILEGSPVYYDRSATMPAGCKLSLSPLDNNGVVNPLFGFVVLDPSEATFLARVAGAAGNTFGCAVMAVQPAIPANVAAHVANVAAATATAMSATDGAAGWLADADKDASVASFAAALVDIAELRTKVNAVLAAIQAAGLMA